MLRKSKAPITLALYIYIKYKGKPPIHPFNSASKVVLLKQFGRNLPCIFLACTGKGNEYNTVMTGVSNTQPSAAWGPHACLLNQ